MDHSAWHEGATVLRFELFKLRKGVKNDKGYDYVFRHVNGDKVAPRVFKLGNFLDGYAGKSVIVAEGRNFDPCIICFRGQLRSAHGIGVLYHVWKGIRAQGSDGFDTETPIVKGAPDAIDAILEDLRRRPTSGYIAESPPPKHRKITLQYRKNVRNSSKPEHGNITCYPTKVPANEPVADTLPQECKDLIEEWLGAHPEQDYSTLPCGTTSSGTYPYRGHGAPMLWKYKDGRRLQAQSYNLPLSSRPGSLQIRKRVIIVKGKDIGPHIVAHKPGPDATVLKGAAKIWLGFSGGDQYGFEKGISVFKQYTTGERFTNVPKIPTPSYERSHADGSQQERSCRPPSKRLRPDLDATKYSSSVSPTKPKATMAIPRQSSVLALTSLRPHLLYNLVCLFYASDKPAPRIRLFNACDTPQKLFAQAMAGELFDPSKKANSGSRVLRIRFGKSTPTTLVLVEDDGDDFEALLEGVANSGWFTERKGGIEGSGSIEIRAVG